MIALRPGVVQEWSGRSDLGWTLNSKWNLHEWKRRKGKSRQWKQPGKGTKQIWVCFVMWTVESQSGKRGVWRLESRVVGRADLDKVQWVTLQRASEARQRSLAIGRGMSVRGMSLVFPPHQWCHIWETNIPELKSIWVRWWKLGSGYSLLCWSGEIWEVTWRWSSLTIVYQLFLNWY